GHGSTFQCGRKSVCSFANLLRSALTAESSALTRIPSFPALPSRSRSYVIVDNLASLRISPSSWPPCGSGAAVGVCSLAGASGGVSVLDANVRRPRTRRSAASRRLIPHALANISSLSGDIVIFLKRGDQFVGDRSRVARPHSFHCGDQFFELCGREVGEAGPRPFIVNPRDAVLAQNPQHGLIGGLRRPG